MEAGSRGWVHEHGGGEEEGAELKVISVFARDGEVVVFERNDASFDSRDSHLVVADEKGHVLGIFAQGEWLRVVVADEVGG